MSTDTTIEEQRALWGTNPRDWAELAEPQNRPLFEELLDATAVTNATRLLDVACGSGYAVALAADRGAHVSGIDITPALLEIARERSPGADLREGEMGALPFADSQFDVVTATNAFQFALDPEQALHDATRVLVPGGRVAAATFAEPERNEGTAIHLAMKALLGNDSDDHHQPYSLSTPSGLRDALTNAGVHVTQTGEVALAWRYPDTGTTLRAILASAGGARALRAAGPEHVRDAILAAITPFQTASGAVTIHNVFRYAIGAKP